MGENNYKILYESKPLHNVTVREECGEVYYSMET